MGRRDAYFYGDTMDTSKVRRLNRRHKVKLHKSRLNREKGYVMQQQEREETEREQASMLFLAVNRNKQQDRS